MTILGKLLAILNVLAAGVFVYLVAIDWASRQTWSYAVFRHDLVLEGLPLDESVRDPFDNLPVVYKLSDNTLQKIFQPVGGQPVRTQTEEVKRIHDLLRAQIDAQGNDDAKRKKLEGLLPPLGRTVGERVVLRQRILDKKVPVNELLADFEAVFEEVLQPEVTYDGEEAAKKPTAKYPAVARLLPKDKRASITHLLFNIDISEPAHQRLQAIIGLKAYCDEAYRQAALLKPIRVQLNRMISDNRIHFELEHRSLMNDLYDLAENIEDRNAYLENQKLLNQEHEQLIKKRQDEIEDVKTRLNASRDSITKALEAQAEEEKILFESQRVLGSIVAENERLEQRIRALERVKRADGSRTR